MIWRSPRIFIFALVGMLPIGLQAASLNFSPSTGNVTKGRTLTVAVKVNSGGTAINAAEGTVAFPTTILQLGSVSRSGSIFSLWTTNPSGSNGTGRIVFSGGLPSPGYTGNAGTIIVMSFTTKNVGTAQLSLSGAKVLANDGQGTNVLTSTGSGRYTVTEAAAPPPAEPEEPARPTPNISSLTHPDENRWFQATEAQFSFTKPTGLLGVSYVLTQTATTTPDQVPDPAEDVITVLIPEDGTWYVHLRGQYENGWSATDHYTIRRDTTAPEPFTLKLERDRGPSDPTPTISFNATDVGGGIARYTLTHNGVERGEVSSPYTLEITIGGDQEVVIVATDQAGNTREAVLSFSSTGYPGPTITGLTDELILLDRLTIRGTAQAGDTVILFVDGEEVARVAVPGKPEQDDDVIVRLPWTHIEDRVFGPGVHNVTAVSVAPDGRTSAPTDPRKFTVSATAITFGGRTIATFAAAPIALLVLLILLLVNFGVIGRLYASTRGMHKKESMVDAELHDLQHKLLRSKMSMREVEAEIERIEDDLERPSQRTRRAGRAKRRA